jgi:hypothetical protein
VRASAARRWLEKQPEQQVTAENCDSQAFITLTATKLRTVAP